MEKSTKTEWIAGTVFLFLFAWALSYFKQPYHPPGARRALTPEELQEAFRAKEERKKWQEERGYHPWGEYSPRKSLEPKP